MIVCYTNDHLITARRPIHHTVDGGYERGLRDPGGGRRQTGGSGPSGRGRAGGRSHQHVARFLQHQVPDSWQNAEVTRVHVVVLPRLRHDGPQQRLVYLYTM